MIQLHHSRRLQRFFGSRIFTLFVLILVILVIIVTAIKFSPNNSDSKTLISPVVKQDLVVNLISLPDDASGSSTIMTEYRLRHGQPFQVMNVDVEGSLTDLPISASASAKANIFVFKSLPTQPDTKRLFEYWRLLSQSATDFESLWVSDSHFGLVLREPTLVVFGPTDVSTNLATLQQIRSHSTMTLQGAVIDLRFDKPVISQNQISIE